MQASTSLPVFKRRASLFYDDDEVKTPVAKATPLSQYEKRLSIEIKEWNEIVATTNIKVENRNNENLKADKSCLTEKEKLFLDSAPDFDDIIATSNTYCKKMEFFLDILAKRKERETEKMKAADSFLNTKSDQLVKLIVHDIPEY